MALSALVCTSFGPDRWFLRSLTNLTSISKIVEIKTQNCFVQACASEKQVLDCIRMRGIEQNSHVANNLLKHYITDGKLQNAQALFNELTKKDIASWTIMIGGYAKLGQAEDALQVYNRMCNEGWQPNAITYLSVLKACASPGALSWGKEIHTHIIRDGLETDVRICTALVTMYAKCGSIENAKAVFDRTERRNIITWSAMISGLAQHGFGNEAFSLFLQMQKEGHVPNSVTYISILNPSSSAGALEWVKDVHDHAKKAGLDIELSVGTALLSMYAKCGSIEGARAVFERMQSRSVISWSAMIGGLAQHGLGYEAFSLFLQMQKEGIIPNSVTYLSILNPCSSAGAFEWVNELHAHAVKAGLDVDVRVGNAFINMYAKIGSIAEARTVFQKMLVRDVISWTVMIAGLAQHGHGREALRLFEDVKVTGFEPTESLHVAVLTACSHAGLVDEGRFQFVSMLQDNDCEPGLEQYTCMVDALGRAGHLEEARLFILNMPTKTDLVIWKALLGACRFYNNKKLAEFAAKECLKLEPIDPSPYVLLSNIYSAVGDWDEVSSIRSKMEERGIRKDSGRCWIEVDNEVHHFVAGDKSHPEAREVYATLNSLFEKLKAEGYNPDTRLVLRNMDEEDKESSLRSHSEKLAIAYGMMHVAPERPIRIYKNLRICTDCHTATKLISKSTGRDIVARDVNRFHHFKDGSCSCGDYW